MRSQVGDCLVHHHYPFGLPGRPGSIDNIQYIPIASSLYRKFFLIPVKDRGQCRTGYLLRQPDPFTAQKQLYPGILQHIADAL